MMLDVELEQRGIHIDWIAVRKWFQIITFGLFCAAAGGWFKSIDVKEASLPYRDRATNQLEHIQAKAGKDPVALIQCLHRRADLAEEHTEDALAMDRLTPSQRKELLSLPSCSHPPSLMKAAPPLPVQQAGAK